MEVKSNQFVRLADIALADETLQAAVGVGTRTAYDRRLVAMATSGAEYGEALRQQAAAIKRRALARLPDLLEEAETRMQANGVQVRWAADAAEARAQVLEIARAHDVRLVAKSKSMATEEIALNSALAGAGLDVVETDLGEYILQLNDEAPSHIVAPVIHKSKTSIRDIFVQKIGMPPTDDAPAMAHYARQQLREVFLTADMGISGGNFLIAAGPRYQRRKRGSGHLAPARSRGDYRHRKGGRHGGGVCDADTAHLAQRDGAEADGLYDHDQWPAPPARGGGTGGGLRDPAGQRAFRYLR
jgi:L-lactate dehydrogenase complex protein LldF